MVLNVNLTNQKVKIRRFLSSRVKLSPKLQLQFVPPCPQHLQNTLEIPFIEDYFFKTVGKGWGKIVLFIRNGDVICWQFHDHLFHHPVPIFLPDKS